MLFIHAGQKRAASGRFSPGKEAAQSPEPAAKRPLKAASAAPAEDVLIDVDAADMAGEAADQVSDFGRLQNSSQMKSLRQLIHVAAETAQGLDKNTSL